MVFESIWGIKKDHYMITFLMNYWLGLILAKRYDSLCVYPQFFSFLPGNQTGIRCRKEKEDYFYWKERLFVLSMHPSLCCCSEELTTH